MCFTIDKRKEVPSHHHSSPSLLLSLSFSLPPPIFLSLYLPISLTLYLYLFLSIHLPFKKNPKSPKICAKKKKKFKKISFPLSTFHPFFFFQGMLSYSLLLPPLSLPLRFFSLSIPSFSLTGGLPVLLSFSFPLSPEGKHGICGWRGAAPCGKRNLQACI